MANDAALERAMKLIKESEEAERIAREKRARAEQFLALYREFADVEIPPVEATPPAATPAINGAVRHDPSLSREVPAYSTTAEIHEAVRAVLTEAGEPTHIRDVYKRVIAMGVRIPGMNPAGNLSAKLNSAPDIVYIRSLNSWWFSDNRPFRRKDSGAGFPSLGNESAPSQ